MSSLRYLVATGLAICIIIGLSPNQLYAAPKSNAGTGITPLTTYERFLPLAVAGDTEIQHFLGYMFFYGEGVELNYESAHYWFHLAAEEGDHRAQRNLGIFHSRAVPRIPDKYYNPEEANLWFSLAAATSYIPEISTTASRFYERFLSPDATGVLSGTNTDTVGETVYVSFCAGCHGFNGHAAYEKAPSFALGERLDQDDDTLVDSILFGSGSMPAWSDTLPEQAVWKTINYIRNLYQPGASDTAADYIQSSSALQIDQNYRLPIGTEKAYQNFCAGCHGFNGIAWYVNSPSFALRERLDKQDTELAYSIKHGLGEMPSWEHMLNAWQIDALIRYIRTFSVRYENGIMSELHQAPPRYFRFRGESVQE